MNVLIITTEWPTPDQPTWVPFLVQQVEYLRKAKITVDVYHFRGRGRPINYIKAWFDIRRQSAWENADLLHAHWGQSGLLTLFSKKKSIVTFHGSDLLGVVNSAGNYTLSGKLLVLASKFVAIKSDYCIAVSKLLQDRLPKKAISKVIPCGLNMDLFRPLNKKQCRVELGLALEKKYVLFVANPKNPIKRYYLAEDATNIIKKDLDVELLVADGIPHEKIPEYMNAADVLVLSSVHEGSPTVIKEAIACNLPIVSVDVGDVRELTQSIEGCIICEPSAKAIADAIIHVLAWGKRINATEIVNSLDETRNVQMIINIYQQVLTHGK